MAACFSFQLGTMLQVYEERLSLQYPINTILSSMNAKRVLSMAAISIPVNIAHILFFTRGLPYSTPIEYTWRIGIIASHATLAVVFSILGLLVFLSNRNMIKSGMHRPVPYIAAATTLAMGVVIVTIDQLVTTSITPYLVGCLVVGVVFLLHPRQALLLFSLSYLAYYFALPITQSKPAILLSNRVNGITSAGIGLFLSILLYRSMHSDLQHKQTIEEQQKELEQKNLQLERLAFFDQLTGIYNRRKFEELIGRQLELMKQDRFPSCLVLVDIDRFKEINDTYGHLFGDTIMKAVATTFAKHIRPIDVLARWGGDEFLILLSHTTVDEARTLVENLQHAVEAMHTDVGFQSVKVTTSFGIAALQCGIDDPYGTAYKDADSALYQAKQLGKNRVEVAQIQS